MRISETVLLPVAPFAGAWIEITRIYTNAWNTKVAPFAGAWIEITIGSLRFPSIAVAPFAGAWIEMKDTLTVPRR